MKIICSHCGCTAEKAPGAINRSRAIGAPLYCSRTCCGLARRQWKTEAQKKEEKRLYDQQYRANNLAWIKAKKHEHFKRTYDPVKAAVERKCKQSFHNEYCRRPEYKAWKSQYDRAYRAREFGEFAEASMLLIDLNSAILERASRYEIDLQNGSLNKANNRKREYRRIVGSESQERAVGNPQRDQVGHDTSGSGRRHRRTSPGNPAHGQDAASNCRPVQAQRPD